MLEIGGMSGVVGVFKQWQRGGGMSLQSSPIWGSKLSVWRSLNGGVGDELEGVDFFKLITAFHSLKMSPYEQFW